MSRQQVIAYRGAVQIRRDTVGPLNLTLIGKADDGTGETTYLAFANATPLDMPAYVQDVVVHRIGAQSYHVITPNAQWTLDARSMHLHRDVAAGFYEAVPPRGAPLWKRLFWRVVLWLAATSVGRVLLARRG